MAESLFDIFGDQIIRQGLNNVSRQPFSNIENNMKKTVGPLKPNEPSKKVGDIKKSFLHNSGKALQSTPARKIFSPRAVNVGSLIYNDNECNNNFKFEDIEFTKSTKKYDKNRSDLLDFLILSDPEETQNLSPPNTPPPLPRSHNMDFDCSYQDEFFTDDFSRASIPIENDLNLPQIY